jgi:hypothetical protein
MFLVCGFKERGHLVTTLVGESGFSRAVRKLGSDFTVARQRGNYTLLHYILSLPELDNIN